MPDTWYLLAAIGVSAAVTWTLRALPFTALKPLRGSAVMRYLDTTLPTGVMVILLAYCLRDLPVAETAQLIPTLLALTVTIGLHAWRHNALLSIIGGTAVNVVLVSTVFAL